MGKGYGPVFVVVTRELLIGSKEILMGKIKHMLWTVIGTALFCKKYELVHHIFPQVFVGARLSVGDANGASYRQKKLEACGTKKYSFLQELLLLRPL